MITKYGMRASMKSRQMLTRQNQLKSWVGGGLCTLINHCRTLSKVSWTSNTHLICSSFPFLPFLIFSFIFFVFFVFLIFLSFIFCFLLFLKLISNKFLFCFLFFSVHFFSPAFFYSFLDVFNFINLNVTVKSSWNIFLFLLIE